MLNMIIKFSPTWRGGAAYLKQAKNSPLAGSGGPLASALGNANSAPTITSAQKLVRRCDISGFRFFIHLLSFHCLAFRDLSSLRTHFWPFTEVLRKIRSGVTRKVARWRNFEAHAVASNSRMARRVP